MRDFGQTTWTLPLHHVLFGRISTARVGLKDLGRYEIVLLSGFTAHLGMVLDTYAPHTKGDSAIHIVPGSVLVA